MSLNDRQEEILKSLYQFGAVEVEALAYEWSVTTQTVRRDLTELCASGLALRTHGGAKRMNTKAVVAYADRRLKHTLAKRFIADAASNIIPNGASLTLNIGTTTEMVAEALRFHKDLTVVSNNINIVQILRASRLKSLVLIGGEIRLSDGAII
jgi:DeoR family glycerol-3-phosphate regulon repressor